MSGMAKLQPFLADAYRQRMVAGQSDEQACIDLSDAMRGDSELALLAVYEVDRLQHLMRMRPQQCYVSKTQSEFLTRALEKIRVG